GEDSGEGPGVAECAVFRGGPPAGEEVVEVGEAVAIAVELVAGGDEGAESGDAGEGNTEAGEFGGEEFFFEVEFVADNDGAVEVGEEVAGDLVEAGRGFHPGVGDAVECRVADRGSRVDEGGVFVEDGAVAAHAYDGDFADAGSSLGVEAGGFEVEDRVGERAGVESAASGESPVVEHHGEPPENCMPSLRCPTPQNF